MNLFEAIFAHDSTASAIHYRGRDLTYGELRARTLRMAQALTSLGAARGDRVVLLLNDSPEFIEAFIAICSLGAIAVPINMALRIEDQCSILHNCGARLALVKTTSAIRSRQMSEFVRSHPCLKKPVMRRRLISP
jgi:acyl-CoA synthetase (AMP-forming)/AMP-acid ligase II